MKVLVLVAVLLLQTRNPLPQAATQTGTASIAGRVLFSDGTPAPNTTLQLAAVGAPANTARTIRSDGTGGYRAQNMLAGRFYLRMPLAGGAFVYYPGVPDESAATVLTIAEGSTNNGLDFTLPASASGVRVTGHVTFPENQSVKPENVTVRITGVQTPARVAENGTFEFAHIRSGTVQLGTSSPGSQPILVAVADRDVSGIELVVPPLVRVTVAIAVEPGTARPAVGGMVITLAGVAQTRLAPQPDGTFTAQVPPGEYRPSMTPMPAGYYLKSLNSGTNDLFANGLKVIGTETPIQIVATLGKSAGVKVTGRVKDLGSNGLTTPNGRLMLLNPVTNDLVEVPINEDGSFEVAKIMPGFLFARVSLTATMTAPFTTITIPNKDVQDFEVPIPGLKEITGRVAVDQNGPSPRFSLLLVRGNIELPANGPNDLPLVTPAALPRTLATGNQILQINLNPLPDGMFKIKLPEGSYRVAYGGMIEPYFLRSISYGQARLTTDPLVISAKETEEIHIGIGTKESNPWLKVSGKVTGFDVTRGPFRVTLAGNQLATIETHLNTDGTFEFPSVLRGNTYTAKLVPASDATSAPRITVADKDLTNVEIVVPPEKEVTIRVSGEANTPIPGFQMTLTTPSNTMTVIVKPDRDGVFTAKLPADERQVRISGLPIGYDVKSLTYGETDLTKQRLKVAAADSMEIRVGLTIDPKVPMGSLRGRVTGLDPERRNVNLVLHAVASFSSFDVALNADGSFNFGRIPMGAYLGMLEGDVVASQLTPRTVVVSGPDLAAVELAAPKTGAQPTALRPLPPDSSVGATVSDIGGGSREAANESASVGNIRTINTALVVYLSSNNGNYGSMQDLVNAGLLDPSFLGPRSGYQYSIIAVGSNYAAAAIPVSSDVARFGYYAVPDAVVRYSTVPALSPPGQMGLPVQ